MNLFRAAGKYPVIAQYAEEKQTILSFVAAGLGVALVPSSYRNMNADGVTYLPLAPVDNIAGLPLCVMWHQGNRDIYVNAVLNILADNLEVLTKEL
jgi:DNA-binding transcriptional LysR family regulator